MTIALLIEPLDLLFCRDGRPIVAGEGAAAGSSLPGPQVLAGAIRTTLLRQRGFLPADGGRPQQAHLDAVLKVAVRGPLLADLRTAAPLIPMPADLVGDKPKHGQVGSARTRLHPLAGIPGWTAPPDAPQALPLWPRPERADRTKPQGERVRPGASAAQSGFLTWAGFQTWQAGGVPAAADIRAADQLFATEVRTQVGLDVASAIAADGVLFSTRYLRLTQHVGFYVEIDGADDFPQAGTLLLGGDRRQAGFSRLSAPVAWQASGSVMLALTPTILAAEDGRCPATWKAHCRGLAIPGAESVSGWDLAANGGKGAPRPTRWAIPAGAVWHLGESVTTPSSIGCECSSGFGWTARGTTPSST